MKDWKYEKGWNISGYDLPDGVLITCIGKRDAKIDRKKQEEERP